MIVADRKPLDEIVEMLNDYQKILIAGCGTCVEVCHAGGEKEVGILASMLKMRWAKDGIDKELILDTVERQCEEEFIEPLGEGEKLNGVDAILSLACGVGVNFLAEKLVDIPISSVK